MKTHAAAAALACGVLVAGCAGSSTGPAGPGPQPTPTGGEIRAARVDRVVCQGPFRTHADVSLKPSEIRRFVLCALPIARSRTAVIVMPGDPAFTPLATALAKPDEPKSTGACPAYADLTQLVFATTTVGRVLVHIPVDGCGHFQGGALQALSQARNADASG